MPNPATYNARWRREHPLTRRWPRSFCHTVWIYCLLFLFLAGPGRAGINTWSEGRPEIADVRCIAVHPLLSDVIVVGTYDGVLRSDDSGATWHRLNGLPTAGFVELEWSPVAPYTLYAAGDDATFHISHDGGEQWSHVAMPSTVLDLAISPGDPLLLYAALDATYGGCGMCQEIPEYVARSTDGGVHWTRIAQETSGVDYYSLVIDPSTPSTLYIGTSAAVWKSTNNGDTWRDVTPETVPRRFQALALDPWNPAIAYAGSSVGVFKSWNGGDSWTLLSAKPREVRDLVVHPDHPSILLTATEIGILRSLDGGETWAEVRRFGGSIDAFDVEIDPLVPTRIYAGTRGDGLLRSSDQGATWAILDVGVYLTPWIRTMTIVPGPPPSLFVGTYSGGVFRSLDGGRTWKRRNKGLGTGNIRLLASAPSSGQVLYAGTWDGVYRSFDGGSSWSLGGVGLRDKDITALVVDPQRPGWLYAADHHHVFRSQDAGDSWRTIRFLSSNEVAEDLAVDPTDPASVYLLTRTHIEISRDYGDSWIQDSVGLPTWSQRALTMAPDRPSVLFVGGTQGVYKSRDNGSTWEPANGGMCAGIECPDIRDLWAVDHQRVFALGWEELFHSRDGAESWHTLAVPTLFNHLVVHPWAPSTFFLQNGSAVTERTEVDCESPEARCFADGRFLLEVGWRDFENRRGIARAQPFSSNDSTVMWFFQPDNWEVLAKVIDGTSWNGHQWVFGGAATNVETVLRVVDTETGRARSYHNSLGTTAASLNDVEAFAISDPPLPPGAVVEEVATLPPTPAADRRTGFDPDAVGRTCEPSPQRLCLLGGRFEVGALWRDFVGGTGFARVADLTQVDPNESGILWFFEPDNWELLVKLIDGCGWNSHHWVFAAATTNVGYTLTVTDTVSGEVVEYTNPHGQSSATVTDVEAFVGCGS